MRKEIAEALDYASVMSSRPVPPEFQRPPDPSIDYSQFVTAEAKQNLAKVEHYLDAIRSCLQDSQGITDLYLGSATSIVALIDASESNEIIIELTLYGPLAAIFTYGAVPQEVLGQVTICIDALGLIRLSPQEIAHLESTNEYLMLFE